VSIVSIRLLMTRYFDDAATPDDGSLYTFGAFR
jgi:hypothetical protein